MRRKTAILAGILLVATAAPASAAPASAASGRHRPQIAASADAVAAVRRSAAYLQSLSTLALDATTMIETFDKDGTPVAETDRLRYEYSAADGLMVDWSSRGERRRIYSNGYIVTFFLPDSATYVSIPKLASDERPGIAAEDIDIVVPLPDFFVWMIADDPLEALPAVRHLGRDRIDGKVTDHYALRKGQIELEIWIDRGARPLPSKILIWAPDHPTAPRFVTSLRWTIEPSLAAGRFTFAPPLGARRIEEPHSKPRGDAGGGTWLRDISWSDPGNRRVGRQRVAEARRLLQRAPQ